MTIAPERSVSLVDTLRPSIHGDVISAADIAYNDARKVWNGMIGKRPAAIRARLCGCTRLVPRRPGWVLRRKMSKNTDDWTPPNHYSVRGFAMTPDDTETHVPRERPKELPIGQRRRRRRIHPEGSWGTFRCLALSVAIAANAGVELLAVAPFHNQRQMAKTVGRE